MDTIGPVQQHVSASGLQSQNNLIKKSEKAVKLNGPVRKEKNIKKSWPMKVVGLSKYCTRVVELRVTRDKLRKRLLQLLKKGPAQYLTIVFGYLS